MLGIIEIGLQQSGKFLAEVKFFMNNMILQEKKSIKKTLELKEITIYSAELKLMKLINILVQLFLFYLSQY